MARLPVPGSDDGAWGTILNEFLEVAHAADGTLRAGVATTEVLVAASDSPAAVRALADHVCDGVDDQVQINQAIDGLAPLGGRLRLGLVDPGALGNPNDAYYVVRGEVDCE